MEDVKFGRTFGGNLSDDAALHGIELLESQTSNTSDSVAHDTMYYTGGQMTRQLSSSHVTPRSMSGYQDFFRFVLFCLSNNSDYCSAVFKLCFRDYLLMQVT